MTFTRFGLLLGFALVAAAADVSAQSRPAGCFADPLNPLANHCPEQAARARQNGEIRQAPPSNPSRPSRPPASRPEVSENPGAENLRSRVEDELLSRPKDRIVERIDRRIPGTKRVLDIHDRLDPGPGDVFCLPLGTTPAYKSCGEFVDASWPEPIDPRQGVAPPSRSESNRSDELEDALADGTCVPFNPGYPIPSREGRCMTQQEMAREREQILKDQDRRAQEERATWMAPRENAQFYNDLVDAKRRFVQDPSLSPEIRDEVEQGLWFDEIEADRLRDKGIFPPPSGGAGGGSAEPWPSEEMNVLMNQAMAVLSEQASDPSNDAATRTMAAEMLQNLRTVSAGGEFDMSVFSGWEERFGEMMSNSQEGNSNWTTSGPRSNDRISQAYWELDSKWNRDF